MDEDGSSDPIKTRGRSQPFVGTSVFCDLRCGSLHDPGSRLRYGRKDGTDSGSRPETLHGGIGSGIFSG